MIIVSNYFNVAKAGKRKFPSVLLYCKCTNCSCVLYKYYHHVRNNFHEGAYIVVIFAAAISYVVSLDTGMFCLR